jgi:cyclase
MTLRILPCLLWLASLAWAQPPAGPPSVEKLGEGVYSVKGGSGANCGFIVGKREVVIIDAKMTADSAKAMLAEIAKVTRLPVKQLILTHSDGDHVNGLSGFPTGLTILAHQSTRKDMEQAFQGPKMSALAAWLPNNTFASSRPLRIPGMRMELLYFGPAHTSGDVIVLLPKQKIAFLGDLAFIGRDPLIHRQKGGTSAGLAATLKQILALPVDTFMAGHAGPIKKTDIQQALQSLEEKQAKVKALVAQGKSLDEVKKEFGVPGGPGQRFPSIAEVIYLEATERK